MSFWCWLRPLQLSHPSPLSRPSPSPPRGCPRLQPCSPQGALVHISTGTNVDKSPELKKRVLVQPWQMRMLSFWGGATKPISWHVFIAFHCFCRSNTTYTEQEIKKCFRDFIKDCPEGTLTRHHVHFENQPWSTFLPGGDYDDRSSAKDARTRIKHRKYNFLRLWRGGILVGFIFTLPRMKIDIYPAKDENGCLDFCEFLMAGHCITSATPR